MTEGLSAAAAPAGELAVYERVRQLQSLAEAARAAALGESAPAPATTSTPAAGGGDFASALQSAASASYAPQLTTSVAYSPQQALDGYEAPADEGAGATGYEGLVDSAAQRNGIEPSLLHGLIEQESGFDPSAQSSAGASGLTQLMPSTAAAMGVADPLDPGESIEGGARYLGGLMRQFGGNVSDALAAYNAGPGAVQQYGGVPPYAETEQYVSKVLGYAQAYASSHPEATAGVPA
jgi:soluble lytic murein transglycosylase-like protein